MTAEAQPPAPPLRVDFYVLEGESREGRLRLGCRIAEKAYLAGQRVAVLCPQAAELGAFDELLWTFADGSFVPHQRVDGDPDGLADCPVILTAGPAPGVPVDVVVNLGADLPPQWPGVTRIAEILDGDADRRTAGRVRFKHYRAAGIEPQTHNVQG